jgi:hypothetical protein
VNEEQVIALLQLQAAQTSLHLEMRDLMRAYVTAPDPADVFVAGCQHPEDSRVDLSTPSDRNHWVCRDCRYDSKSVA